MSEAKSAAGGPGVHAALFVVQLAFASQAVEGKLLMGLKGEGGEAFPPIALALVRMLGATLAFALVSHFSGRRREPEPTPLSRSDLARLFGLSLLGVTVNQTLFLIGLTYTTSVTATLLCVAIPVFTTGLSVMLRKEKLSFRIALGLLSAGAGVVLLTGIARPDVGAVLVTLNSLSYSLYLVLARTTLARIGVFRSLSWLFLFGALALLPIGSAPLVRALVAASPRALLLVAFVIAVPTVIAYLANAWALVRSTPSLVTTYIFLQPVLAAAIAWAQLGQRLSPRLLYSAPLIVLGVMLAALRGGVRGSRSPS